MSEEKSETRYPVKSIHDFLLEVERELRRFRIASLIGVIAWLLILPSLIRFSVRLIELAEVSPRARVELIIDMILLALAALSLCYLAYTLYRQNRFFKRWGRRFELLKEFEQKLLGEKNDSV